jgi:regulator of RNase E activity RraA
MNINLSIQDRRNPLQFKKPTLYTNYPKTPAKTNPNPSSTAPFSPIIGRNDRAKRIAAPATTFKFLSKKDQPPQIALENPEKHGFPPGKHWVDFVGDFAAADPANAGSIVVIDQPKDQYCAVTGGIMATRMKVLGIRAAVVNGRVRDLRELVETELPVCLSLLFCFLVGYLGSCWRLILEGIDLGEGDVDGGHWC